METLLDRYEEAVRKLPVTATSQQGWLTVRRDATGDLSVTLRPGTLAQISERTLAAELADAMTSAYRTYRNECRELRRKIFGADFDEIHARADQWRH